MIRRDDERESCIKTYFFSLAIDWSSFIFGNRRSVWGCGTGDRTERKLAGNAPRYYANLAFSQLSYSWNHSLGVHGDLSVSRRLGINDETGMQMGRSLKCI